MAPWGITDTVTRLTIYYWKFTSIQHTSHVSTEFKGLDLGVPGDEWLSPMPSGTEQSRCPGNCKAGQGRRWAEGPTGGPHNSSRSGEVLEDVWAKGWNPGSREQAQRVLSSTFSWLLAFGLPAVMKAFITISVFLYFTPLPRENILTNGFPFLVTYWRFWWARASIIRFPDSVSTGLSIRRPLRSEGYKSSSKCWIHSVEDDFSKFGLNLRVTSFHLTIPKLWSRINWCCSYLRPYKAFMNE